MMAQRELPTRLREKAGERSADAVHALRTAMAEIKADIEAAGYDLIRPLKINDVQERAGLNAKFLYGKRHKETTKVEVEKFVEAINEVWRNRNRDEPEDTPLSRARDEAEFWRMRHARLASHVNSWFAQMRQLRRRIRDLETINSELMSAGGKVVRLVRDQPED